MPQEREAGALYAPVGADDWWKGPDTAPVTVVEYFDYDCPKCQALYRRLERLLQAYRDKVRLVVRHFPMPAAHPHALDAALAAEAAGAQGRFWDMHDLIFRNPRRLESSHLLQHARALALDLERFERDWNDPALRRKVYAQRREGARSGVRHTPALFINGRRYQGEFEYEALSSAVEQAPTSRGEVDMGRRHG